jgi:hypothetical protein
MCCPASCLCRCSGISVCDHGRERYQVCETILCGCCFRLVGCSEVSARSRSETKVTVEELGDGRYGRRITDPITPSPSSHRCQHYHASQLLGDSNLAESVKRAKKRFAGMRGGYGHQIILDYGDLYRSRRFRKSDLELFEFLHLGEGQMGSSYLAPWKFSYWFVM